MAMVNIKEVARQPLNDTRTKAMFPAQKIWLKGTRGLKSLSLNKYNAKIYLTKKLMLFI